ncbi:ImmA/IrrE family metallo-endopeptidase [Deinococcus sonorensis]|uniref:ImmA/IrrE family metallo-endopeptidase n=1 Tax=Deinococcus sonorensis TaxID=309891 RepID=A0ABV8YEB1_9DEIO
MKLGVPGFVGARLTQAREAMGLSQNGLADRIGVSKQAISRYERDEDSPMFPVLNALAEELNQDKEFFSRPIRLNPSAKVTFYRRLKRVTKAELKKISIWREWYDELVDLLGQYLELPALNLPHDLFLPHNPALIDMAVIEAATLRLREHWGLGQRPIGHLIRQMERNGLLVTRFDFGVDGVDGFSLEAANQPLSLVALNTAKSNAFRSRFDAAHELGHHILHRHVTDEMLKDPATYELVERQAHRFASSLLLPQDAFRDDLYSYNLDALLHLKEKWNVSIAAMLYRMKDMELIDNSEHTALRKSMSGKDWTKREPFDEEATPEKPALLAQAIDTLVNQAGFTKQDVINDLKLRPHIIEQLANLSFGYFDVPESVEINVTNLRLSGT